MAGGERAPSGSSAGPSASVAGAGPLSIYAYRLDFVNTRTDDAAVRASIVGIAPHVSGPIVDLHVPPTERASACCPRSVRR
jgi:multidrug resistance efflux pump